LTDDCAIASPREQLDELEGLLNRLAANVGTEDHAAPWTGLIEQLLSARA
jgi:hypothetical protein